MGKTAKLRPDTLYYGDCLEVMAGWPDEAIDLIYLDPPFNSKQDFSMLFGDAGNGKSAAMTAFEDSWHWGPKAAERVERISRSLEHPAQAAITGLRHVYGHCGLLSYLSYMADRLAECRRLLKDTGAIWVHCDPTAEAGLRILLDGIFDPRNWVNTIQWKRTTTKNDAEQGAQNWPRVSDTLLHYRRSSAYRKFNQPYLPLSDEYIGKSYRKVEEGTGRRYQLTDLSAPGSGRRGHPVYEFMGITRAWRYNEEKMHRLLAAGRIVQTKPGRVPRYKRYLDESKGVAIGDIWTDIAPVQGQAKEGLKYPTQKPLKLLRRIVEATTQQGDLVCDPFCGCGTTIEAAKSLGRRFVGIDIQPFALELVRAHRLPGTMKVRMEGLPRDLASARKLLAADPFKFEAWAISRIPGFVPNERQRGDRGIDGKAKLIAKDANGRDLVLAQVKGHYSAAGLDGFLHTMDREKAAVGVFITLERGGRAARTRAAMAGKRCVGADQGSRCVLWSVEEMFDDGAPPGLPTLADPRTGQALL